MCQLVHNLLDNVLFEHLIIILKTNLTNWEKKKIYIYIYIYILYIYISAVNRLKNLIALITAMDCD